MYRGRRKGTVTQVEVVKSFLYGQPSHNQSIETDGRVLKLRSGILIAEKKNMLRPDRTKQEAMVCLAPNLTDSRALRVSRLLTVLCDPRFIWDPDLIAYYEYVAGVDKKRRRDRRAILKAHNLPDDLIGPQ